MKKHFKLMLTLCFIAACSCVYAQPNAFLCNWNADTSEWYSGYPGIKEIVANSSADYVYFVCSTYLGIRQNDANGDGSIAYPSVSFGADREGISLSIIDDGNDHFLYVLCRNSQGHSKVRVYSLADPTEPGFLAETTLRDGSTNDEPKSICVTKYNGTKYVFTGIFHVNGNILLLHSVDNNGNLSYVLTQAINQSGPIAFIVPYITNDDLWFFVGASDRIYRTSLAFDPSPIAVRWDYDLNCTPWTGQGLQEGLS